MNPVAMEPKTEPTLEPVADEDGLPTSEPGEAMADLFPDAVEGSDEIAEAECPQESPLVGMVLTYNNGGSISSTLASLASVVDTLLVMDMGSTDDTLAIARQYTEHVWLAPSVVANAANPTSDMPQNYAALLAEANHLAPNGWGLWLEPTEWLLPDGQHTIQQWKKTDEHAGKKPADVAGHLLSIAPLFMEASMGWGGLARKEPRLFKLSNGVALNHTYYNGLDVVGPCKPLRHGKTGAIIQACPYPDTAAMVAGVHQLAQRAVLHQVEQNRLKKPGALTMVLAPMWAFVRQFVGNAGFLDGTAGLTLAYAQALQVHLKHVITKQLLRDLQPA